MVDSRNEKTGISESEIEEMILSFQSSTEALAKLFRKYSIEDVAKSIFVSNMWLPNISSPVKHQLLTAVFASMKPEEFSPKDRIKSYDDFRKFVEKVYELIPPFPLLEDYVPTPDWGEVKFHHDGRNQRMFYGTELSNIYEYLTLFQMIHLPIEDEYMKHTDRSPTKELEYCLVLQKEVIDGITAQPDKETMPSISLGHIEIPPEGFWENAQSFYSQFKPEEKLPGCFLKAYSIPLGTLPRESLALKSFSESVFRGTLLPAFFVGHGSRYFCILPRRYSSILFDTWAQIFQKNKDKIEASGRQHYMSLVGQVYSFVKKRLKTNYIYPLVSAVTKDGKLHEIVFATCFISKDKLIILYLTHPSLSGKKIQEELNDIAPKLNEAVTLAASQPVTLALHTERKHIQFHPKSETESLKPEIMVLIPPLSTQVEVYGVTESFPGKVVGLDSFLGIVDEIEDIEDFADFIEFLEEIEGRTQFALSMLDKFAAFKDSYGVLVDGALGYDLIMLDPHAGSQRRYESLARFWSIYPEVDFFDHPRTWKVTQETESRLRFEARGYFGAALHCKIGSTNVYITAPFAEMSFEQGTLSNLLMESLEDSMSLRKSLFQDHDFFKYCDQLQINFFPLSIVTENAKFEHLKHLCKIKKYWCSDCGFPTRGTYGVRIVFDDSEMAKAFQEAQDSSIEVDILSEVLRQLDKMIRDTRTDKIIEALEKTKAGRPRFKLFMGEKPASFPEFINPYEPKPAHFKKAKKRIAELAKELDVSEGYYELEDAKEKLNQLKDSIVSEINSVVAKYDFASAIPFLIARVDAVNARYERKRMGIELGLQHQADYEPKERYAEEHVKYGKMHRNYRYLIEKFVQLEPRGKDKLGRDEFQYIIALIDWLHVFYSASDNLHYDIFPVGMKLDRDYRVEVEYEEGMDAKQKEFSEEMAQLELGLKGNPKDRVDSPRVVGEFLEELDQASVKDLGFSFKSMINVLQVLTFWPAYKSGVEESPSYSAELAEIEDACLESVEGIRREEIKSIVEFLTLSKDDVIRVLGQDEPCTDLPVWEYRKRYSRYNLRPLIKIGGKYYWGPYSARRAGLIWSGTPSTGTLPTDLEAPTIVGFLGTEKRLIENALAQKALEIVKRFTPHARKNLKLHRLKPKGTHPSGLGDYDVLAYYPEKNVVFNVECKDILPVYCLKDAKRLRDKIFGRPGKDEGHFTQINKRKEYLSAHISDIATALDWPVKPEKPPKIITIYLSRRSYWWTHFPPKEIDAKFLLIDLFSDFIQEL